MEFFASFIVMDDPRHARQRGIVSLAFTPRQLQRVLDSVEQVCDEDVGEALVGGIKHLPVRFTPTRPLTAA